MPVSDLGLTQQEVDAIMADMAGTAGASTGVNPVPEPAKGPTVTLPGAGGGTRLSPIVLQPRTGQESQPITPSSVRVLPPQLTAQPIKMNESTPLLPRPPTAAQVAASKPKPSTAPVIVGITTGMVFGGPVGAAIGGGVMWGLSKLLQKK